LPFDDLQKIYEGFDNCVYSTAHRRIEARKEGDTVLGVGCRQRDVGSVVCSRKVEKRGGIQGLCVRNDDLGIGWRARKESDEIRCPDAELSYGMDGEKQLKVKLGNRKLLASRRQSRWDEERVGTRTASRGLEENEDASKCTAVL
jgi:hypothetical protein